MSEPVARPLGPLSVQCPAPASARRRLWMAAGWTWLALGTIGVIVPLLPTVDCYGLAAFCFARGSTRWEAWLLNHPRIGPLVRDWRADRTVPLQIKMLASLSMGVSCLWALHAMPRHIAWIPAAICIPVAFYLWTRPTRRLRAADARCVEGRRQDGTP